MSEEKAKIKNIKRLPLHIHYSVILWYVIMGVIMPLVLLIPGAIGMDIPKNALMFALTIPAPIIGFIVGWWVKFNYARKQDDEALMLRTKAQFWGAMAFVVAFVISILLIMISLIILEQNDLLRDNVTDPIAFIIAMLILGISFWIGNNTKNRIYRNFSPE